MASDYQPLLTRIAGLARDGHLGADVQSAADAYSALPDDLTRCATFVRDYSVPTGDDEIDSARDLFCKLILITYRDAKKRDLALAHDFAFAFFQDFPGAAGSALLPRWSSLADASLAFQSVAHSGDMLLAWQQSSRLVQAANEFLDGLFGLLIVAWRCAQGKAVNVNVLGNAYGSKIDEFSRLTGGDDGVFCLFLRIADSDLRNGIAHGTAWLDAASQKVRYLSGRQQKIERDVDLPFFMCCAALGSHVGAAYVAALSAIAVLESSDTGHRELLPASLVELFDT